MIWLIGSKGMLGSEVSKQLSSLNLSFIESDIEVDITSYTALENYISKIDKPITHIINCAAYTNVDKAETEKQKAFEINVEGPRNLAKFAKKLRATLIHISTDYIFDGNSRVPYTEDIKPNPINIYGETKAKGEEEIIKVLNNYYILRSSWLYGFNGNNFVYTMLNLLNTKDSINVVNDQIGSPTCTITLSKVLIEIIKREINNTPIPYGIYNYTDNGETSWFEFTQEIKKNALKLDLLSKKNCKVTPCTSKEYITKAKRPTYSVLSKEKILNSLKLNISLWTNSLFNFLSSNKLDFNRFN